MIKYSFNIENQIGRYVDLLNRLRIGAFQERRMYLLDHLPEKSRDRVILFPIFNKHLQEINRCQTKSDLSAELRQDILRFAEQIYQNHRQQFIRIRNEWELIEGQFQSLLFKSFKDLTNVDITISPTIYECLGSYSIENEKLLIYPRFDRSISQICHLIVNACTHYDSFPHRYLTGTDWEKKQIAVKENIHSGGYDLFLQPYESMVTILSSHSVGNLIKESVNNFTKIGHPIKPVTDDLDMSSFSPSEKDIFNLLRQNKNEIVSFEDMAKVLWNENWAKNYSLYAITQIIRRIRKRLKAINISQNVIHTQRGKGYILYD